MNTNRLDAMIGLTAHTHSDPRALGLIRLFITMERDGYPKHGRVTTEGGITYLVNRNSPYSRPSLPTLIVSEDEAKVIAPALMRHLFGRSWSADSERIQLLERKFAESERQNQEMRKAKKAQEQELRQAQRELNELRAMRVRYHDVMAVINAVNLSKTIRQPPRVDH